MKKIILSVLLSVAAFANTLNIGDTTPTFAINDQFEKANTFKTETKTIIVAGDRDASEVVRDYLLTKEKWFLESNNSYYLADISGMPSLITKFFALPKMKKYPFSILLLDDTNKDKFSKKEGKITVYSISSGKISDIKYISTAKELAALFK